MSLFKKIVLLIFLAFSSQTLFSQKMSFGYVSSISVPSYSGSGWDSFLAENDAENNPIVGLGLGLTGEYPVSSRISLRTDLLFSAVGGGYVQKSTEGENQARLISEINLYLPLMIKLNLLSADKISFYTMGGFQTGLLLSQSEYTQDGAVFDKEVLNRSSFNPIEWGGTAGFGAEVYMVKQFIYVEIRYMREFSSSFRDRESVYQNNISFSTGMRWESKKK